MLLAVAIGAVLLAVPVDAAVPAAKKTEAAALSTVAMNKATEGKFGVAAEMFHAAFRADPETPGYLYSAARAEHKAGKLALAEAHYVEFLRKAPADDPLVSKAKAYSAELVTARVEAERKTRAAADKKAVAEKAVAPTPATLQPATTDPAPSAGDKPAQAGGWQSTAGWASLGAGVLALGAGGYMVVAALGDASDLDQQLDAGEIDADAAKERRDDAVGQQTTGYLVASAGVALAALGGFWLMTAPDGAQVSFAVDPYRRLALVGLRF